MLPHRPLRLEALECRYAPTVVGLIDPTAINVITPTQPAPAPAPSGAFTGGLIDPSGTAVTSITTTTTTTTTTGLIDPIGTPINP